MSATVSFWSVPRSQTNGGVHPSSRVMIAIRAGEDRASSSGIKLLWQASSLQLSVEDPQNLEWFTTAREDWWPTIGQPLPPQKSLIGSERGRKRPSRRI
jgi:hypothetical protein